MKDEDIKLPNIPCLVNSQCWHHDIQEYARQAVRMNLEGGDKSIIQQARAWEMVHEALSIVKPGWYEGAETGQDAAVKTILDLGAKASAAQTKPSDPEPFDLARAMAGEPIVARDGRKARFVAHVPEAEERPVVAFINGGSMATNFRESGRLNSDYDSNLDILMAPKPKRTVWVNVWPRSDGSFGVTCPAYETKEMAERRASECGNLIHIVIAHPIEIDA